MGILSGLPDSFPWFLWDELIPQVEININMLRQSNFAPTTPEYAYLNGTHDYNCHPYSPLGCAVLLHENPDQHSSWSIISIHCWYTGTSMDNYQKFKTWTKEMKLDRICDTVFSNKNTSLSPRLHQHMWW